ncbi:hypothetical protein [Blautia massiliensis (ex Durand et al. 2017)]|uniref:hypothetical protein n=2 Tax=Blautia massiliensis (ex Durand et al. 2017) TaxID=1737424 RepID=UPI0022DFA53F|nr:hypothetical protein [Blautia massiliensis (ex Durand et al. 2017)]
MALPQDGQNANGLTKVTEIPKGKELIFIDPTTNEGGIITLEDLTTQILKNLTSQTFALDQGTKTLPAALNELNSNRFFATEQTISGIKVAKGSTVEKEFEFPVKAGYTRHYILSSITGTGSNTAVINAHFSVVSVYAPMMDSEVSVKVMCIYTKD